MAHIIKIKPSKGYQWDQDHKNIYVKINMPGHNSIKNVQIFLSDVILRVTSKQKKSSQTLDLANQIDYLSPQNRFTMIDGVINATLKKKIQNQMWPQFLLEGISMAQLKVRRQQSQLKYQNNIKQIQQNKQKLKLEHDKMATREIMRFQEEERKKLDGKKQLEKQQALNQVFRGVDEKTGKIDVNAQYRSQNFNTDNLNNNRIAVKNDKLDSQRKKWQQKSKKALELFEKQEQLQRKSKLTNNKSKFVTEIQSYQQQQQYKSNGGEHKTQNSMFTEDDIKYYDQLRNQVEEQIQEIPIRKQAKIPIKFSDKPYSNIAARDYHYNQAPMPKNNIFPPTKGDLQNKNPLWLKDKGDGFMSDKNYEAALDAYNQALKIDPNQTRVLMNRSLAYMKALNIDASIHDCDSVLLLMQKQLTSGQQNTQQSLLNMVKIKTRKALCLSWKGNLTASRTLLQQQLQFNIPNDIKQQISQCLISIQNRQKSLSTKLKADEKVKKQLYQQAIKIYQQSIQTDDNQYAISNQALCYNKINKYQQAIKIIEKGFGIMNQFGVNTYAKQQGDINGLFMKLLYRNAKALEALNRVKQAQNSLRKGLELNPQDKDFRQALKVIKNKQTIQTIAKLKTQASDLIKNNNSKQALDIYTKCLKMLESAQNTSEYLSILQNQCVCYLKLSEFDSIVSVSNRILKLVNNLNNRIVDFDRRKANITKDQLDKITVRTLVRRANAYIKTGRRQNAKGDLERAVEIDPNDQAIKKQLTKLKEAPVC